MLSHFGVCLSFLQFEKIAVSKAVRARVVFSVL